MERSGDIDFINGGEILKSGVVLDILKKNNLTAVVAPTVSNDNTQGYEVGSVWVDTVLKISYTCVDAATGAAVWDAGGQMTVSSADTSPSSHLDNKVVDGVGITKTILNPAGNESLEFKLSKHFQSLASSSVYTGCRIINGTNTNEYTVELGEILVIDNSLFPTPSLTPVNITAKIPYKRRTKR
jgi:hypothetical protein